jgi:type I restriction enzyme S subunit
MENTNLKPFVRFPEFTENWKPNVLGKQENISFLKGKGISKADIVDDGITECIRYGELYTIYDEVIDDVDSKTNLPTSELVFSKANDVIIPASGETQIDIATASCVLRDDIALSGDLNIIRSEINGIFLSYYLNNKKKKAIARLAQGSSVIHLYNPHLKTLKLNLPIPDEQKKIAEFLTSIETRISSLKEKKDTLLDFKKGVMQKIFNQEIRFKDDNGNDYPDWEEKRVDKLFDVTRGNVLAVPSMKQKRDNIYKYPVYSSQTKDNGLTGYYDEYLFENSITWTTDGANAGEVKFRNGKFYCTNVCGVLISIENANACIAELLNRITHKYVSYVGNPKLMNNIMAGIKTFFPSPEEQIKIANYLTALDDKIDALQQKIETSVDFKKGLLQKMFV